MDLNARPALLRVCQLDPVVSFEQDDEFERVDRIQARGPEST